MTSRKVPSFDLMSKGQPCLTSSGSWEGIAGCVVHVDVHGQCVCCGLMQCSCL